MQRKAIIASFFILVGLSACLRHEIKKSESAASWNISVLDSISSAAAAKETVHSTACAFDIKGNFHGVYLSSGRLRYLYGPSASLKAFQKGHPSLSPSLPKGWRFETIPLNPNKQGQRLVLGLDEHGRPHVFYFSPFGLQHVVLTPSGWAVGLITDRVNMIKPWSVAMSAAGTPLVASEGQPGYLTTMQPTALGWKEERLQETQTKRKGAVQCLKIHFDREDNPNLAFLEQFGSVLTLWHAKRGLQWQAASSVFSLVENTVTRCQIAMDVQGWPQAAYLAWPHPAWDGTENLVYIRREKKGGWKRKVLPIPVIASGNSRAMDFLLDSTDRPHFVFYSAGSGKSAPRGLIYAIYQDKEWRQAVLDIRVELAGNPALAVDSEGTPWILYQDNRSETLKLAFQAK